MFAGPHAGRRGSTRDSVFGDAVRFESGDAAAAVAALHVDLLNAERRAVHQSELIYY